MTVRSSRIPHLIASMVRLTAGYTTVHGLDSVPLEQRIMKDELALPFVRFNEIQDEAAYREQCNVPL